MKGGIESMKSNLKVGLAILVVGSLTLFGCKVKNDSTNINKEIDGTVEEQATSKEEIKEVESSEKDEQGNEIGEWASESKKMLSEPLDNSKLKEANNDEGFEQYLKIKKVVDSFPSEAVEVDSPLSKDFSNILTLNTAMGLYQYSRTSHIDQNGGAKEDVKQFKQWKSIEEEASQVFEYVKQIINDIDVKYNHQGKGQVFGVTYVLDGNKVDEMEKFFMSE